ncbi:glycosyltransferase family 61 protein [Roseomonas sp. SSH11]|uniref:Glycosyltransferase family 61 protein n=1 Tax=Pararoseomonas baculiformis TaxID=2820812 RepID=A0ABS4A9E3_9PROT|nr:glycosyltransferase family 61 protein [Pararoseomonas baculiformis]MBP0443609.1 glycosyltransferase family 61 protein [Pararoseomonas baculiformis]
MASTDREDLPAAPNVIEDGGHRYSFAPRVYASRLPDIAEAQEVWAPVPLKDPGARIIFPDEIARAGFFDARPEFMANELPLGTASLCTFPNASLLHYPRIEGMMVNEVPYFVRETRGSPRVQPGNDMLRNMGKEWFVNLEKPFAGHLERAVVCYDSASRNYAHFMMIWLPRIILANTYMAGVAFVVPDLPSYAALGGASIRSELLYRLPDIMPLTQDNFYWHLGEGRWELEEANIVSVTPDRWLLIFHEEVQAAFTRIGGEALRRHAAIKGSKQGNDLPRRIYVSRQGAQRRRVLNQEELDPVLERHGFIHVKLETMDFFEQAALFARADAVIGLHGAGLANTLFNDGRATLVEIYPAGEAHPHFALCALSRGCRYIPVSSRKVSKHRDVLIDPVQVDRALSLIATSATT